MCLTCCKPLSDAQRVEYTASIFGVAFPLVVEPHVFAMAGRLSEDYAGGYWVFYALSNGGFYMAPSAERRFVVRCENGFDGELSPDAFGIVVCMYAFSHLSFAPGDSAETYAQQYHLLREHALEHREVRSILAAID